MLTVKETIAAYEKAVAEDDRLAATRLLESLEDERFCNEADWKLIHDFCKERNFDGRLEVITGRLIKNKSAKSSKPYLVMVSYLNRSQCFKDARAIVHDHWDILSKLLDDWQRVNLFYNIGDFSTCLSHVQICLRKSPNEFSFRIMEVKSLWKLHDQKTAKSKLKSLFSLLDCDSGHFFWFYSIARELNEVDAARGATTKLLKGIKDKTLTISKDIIVILKKEKLEAELRDIIQSANPGDYSKISEIVSVFESAVDQGIYRTAREFGARILSINSDHPLKKEIDSILIGPKFLMQHVII